MTAPFDAIYAGRAGRVPELAVWCILLLPLQCLLSRSCHVPGGAASQTMSDRKYRQRGYRDEPSEPRERGPQAPKKEYAPRGQPPIQPKTFSMPGFREVVKCARCGAELTVASAWSPGPLRALPGGPPQLRAVRQLRHERRVRMPEAGARARLTQGRPERVHLLRATDDGRARDQVVGRAGQPVERQEGLRRLVQIGPPNTRNIDLAADPATPRGPTAFRVGGSERR